MLTFDQKSILDIVGLIWLLLFWIGYVFFTKRMNLNKNRGLLAAMNRTRHQWVNALLKRENRMVDVQIINGLIRRETFFASTTILMLAGVVALLGLGDKINDLFNEIPYSQKSTLAMLELKVGVLAMTFVFAFFKFTWALRQHTSSAILLGSLPLPGEVNEETEKQAKRMAKLGNLAARHFNDGMRAYYFALAELSWFFHPLALMACTIWITAALYRREFHSKALSIME